MKERIFIIGPIESHPEAFIKTPQDSMVLHGLCKLYLEALFPEAEVVNPHEIVREYSAEEQDDHALADLRIDISEMVECHRAVVIPGWSQSRSANGKIVVAQEWRLPLSQITVENEIDISFKQIKDQKQLLYNVEFKWFIEYISVPKNHTHKILQNFWGQK